MTMTTRQLTDSERLDAVVRLRLRVFETEGFWVVRDGGACPVAVRDRIDTFREAIDIAVARIQSRLTA